MNPRKRAIVPKICIASQNPVKQRASLAAFQRVFPDQAFSVCGVEVESGVSDQPMSRRETLQGAISRAANARAAQPDSDYWVGIEGGIEQTPLGMSCFAWVQVLGTGRAGRQWADGCILLAARGGRAGARRAGAGRSG